MAVTSTKNEYGSAEEIQGTQSPAENVEVTPNLVDEMPDGGWRAWLVSVGAASIFFCSIGWVYAIGAFQAFYESHQYRGKSPGVIAWVSSLELGLIFFLSPFAVAIFQRLGARTTITVGAIIHVFGLMMTSLSKQFYQVVLAQGICSPIGAALTYHTASQVIPTWFKKNQPIAFGICTIGSSVGGVVLPLMVSRLVDDIGYPWTMRTIAFTLLGMFAIGLTTVKARIPMTTKRPDAKAALHAYWRNAALMGVVWGTCFSWLGTFVPLNYIGTYGLSKGMNFSLANDMIMILNGASTCGRILFPLLGKKYGVLNILIVNTVCIVIVTLANWIPAESDASIIVFAVLYGFFSGGPLPLLAAAVSQLVNWDPQLIPISLGMSMMIVSLGALISQPIAGAILDHQNSWLGMKLFAGITQAVALLFYLYARMKVTGRVA